MPAPKEWYRMIQATTPNELVRLVNKTVELGVGWEPMGGPIMDRSGYGSVWCQAVRRKFSKGGPGRPKGSTKEKASE